MASIVALIRRNSFTSSTRPFGQALFTITRSYPSVTGTLLQARPPAPGRATSTNVRWHSTGHHRQTVSRAVVALYVIDAIAWYPRKRVLVPFFQQSRAI